METEILDYDLKEVGDEILEIELETIDTSIKDMFKDFLDCVFVFETNSWSIDGETFEASVKYVVEYEKLDNFKNFIFNELLEKIKFYKRIKYKSGLKIYFNANELNGSFSIDYLPTGLDFVKNVIIYFTIHKLNNF